jgi:GT2 family glycosyltransferase
MSKPTTLHHLSVIIVSYNVRELLRDCLRSVFASAARSGDWLHVTVTVVDNASQDGSAQMVAEEFPQVELIASEENLGFTGGNNLGIGDWGSGIGDRGSGSGEEQSPNLPISQSPIPNTPIPNTPISQSPDLFLLLNPDTELVADALGRMAGFLRDHPGVGMCGAGLRYGDGRFQHGAFRFPGLAQVALDLLPLDQIPGVRRLLPRLLNSRINGRYPAHLWKGDAPFPVDFVLGAAMMVSSKAVQNVGLLDDGYFMYCEEMDWAWRMKQAGWAIYALPGVRVIHHEGQSSRQRPWQSLERLWRSRLRFYRKYAADFPPGFFGLLGGLMRLGFGWRARIAWRAFSRGEISGDQLGQALATYRSILGHLNARHL